MRTKHSFKLIHFKKTIYCIFLSVAISFSCVLLDIAVYKEGVDRQYYMEINMKSSVNSISQLYYDTGNGWSSDDYTDENIKKEAKLRQIKFIIPKKNIYSLRFNPLKTEGRIVIKSIKIIDKFSDEVKDISLHSVKPMNEIKRLKIKKGLLYVDTSKKAYDSMLDFEIDYPVKYSLIRKLLSVFFCEMRKIFIIFTLTFTAVVFTFTEKQENIYSI